MTTVTGFVIRTKQDGTTFIALELTGGLELVQNQSGSGFYATIRTCTIPSTFSENVAKLMVGQQLDGDIVRVPVEQYDYVNKRTGEVMQLTHSYAYRPKGSVELIGQTQVQGMQMA